MRTKYYCTVRERKQNRNRLCFRKISNDIGKDFYVQQQQLREVQYEVQYYINVIGVYTSL